MKDGKEWRCFHCDELFNDRSLAREHFGGTEDAQAACLIKAGAEGSILRALREAEIAAADAWHALHNETSDVHRSMYAQAGRHRQSLQAAEELGYERGMRDMAKLCAVTAETAHEKWNDDSGVEDDISACRFIATAIRALVAPKGDQP